MLDLIWKVIFLNKVILSAKESNEDEYGDITFQEWQTFICH